MTSPRERLLLQLKTRGPQTAAELARRLDVTSMAARQQLDKLADEGLVAFEEKRGGVGRPARVWRLLPAAEERFPEGYAELAVDLIGQVRAAFGERGLEQLTAARSAAQREAYAARMPARSAGLGKRVAALARLRTGEGYMAESRKQRDGSWLLIENHCPICAAASICQGLCSGELEIFRALLGEADVERSEHMLDGSRRCVYRVTPKAR